MVQLTVLSIIDKLTKINNELLELRDGQELIACNTEESCICNRFDDIRESISNLITEFELINK
ncbi:hypothetical protein LCGC14_1563380 [marine sediment metagenome]|uniref:Uncharacterized protein n=1 Tax=marine sediment metagenome TaxID=412755 RepID=A0A0F9ILU0_9ZZZZ